MSKIVKIWQTVETHAIDCGALPGLFNPYVDRHPEWDREGSPSLRQENLKNYLADHAFGVDLFLLAEAPGPWGCRFSGVPIMSEAQLLDPAFPAKGTQSTVREKPFSEYSASIYWRILAPYYRSIFTWNTVPMHPFKPGKPDSIRAPRQSEINQFLPLLQDVVTWARPGRIVAVGRKAENALTRLGLEAEYIRHPSQGGARLFEEGVRRVIADLGLQPESAIV